MFPKRCHRWATSFLEGEGVPKNWDVVTEGINNNNNSRIYIVQN